MPRLSSSPSSEFLFLISMKATTTEKELEKKKEKKRKERKEEFVNNRDLESQDSASRNFLFSM